MFASLPLFGVLCRSHLKAPFSTFHRIRTFAFLERRPDEIAGTHEKLEIQKFVTNVLHLEPSLRSSICVQDPAPMEWNTKKKHEMDTSSPRSTSEHVPSGAGYDST